MRNLLFLLVVLAAGWTPVMAQEKRQVIWQFTIDGSYREGDRVHSLKAKPRVACVVGSPAEIGVGPASGEKGVSYSIRCNAKEVVAGNPTLLRVNIGLSVRVPGADVLEQSFETLVVDGEPWVYRWEKVKGLEYLSVDGTPYLVPPGLEYAGADEQGKPRWKKAGKE